MKRSTWNGEKVLQTLRALWVAKVLIPIAARFLSNSPHRFVYFLKACGFQDGQCVVALDVYLEVEYSHAMQIVYRILAVPFRPDEFKENRPIATVERTITVRESE